MKLTETLAALRQRIQQRVEGRVPEVPDLRPASLDRLAKKRETAQYLADLVGTVNPRPGGLHNHALQAAKRVMARALRWYGHPQREFNRALLEALDELRELFADQNRNLLVLGQMLAEAERARQQALEELELFEKEVREQCRSLDGRIMANVQRLTDAQNYLQDTFWKDFERYREQHHALHLEDARRLEEELRLVRQRLRAIRAAEPPEAAAVGAPSAPQGRAQGPASTTAPMAVPAFDYPHFEERFRGTEKEIREKQLTYVPFFRERAPVLDLACGRGEFLRLLREHGIEARGVDLDPDMVGRCREQGLEVASGDAFAHLENLGDESLGGIFSAQFIEHLPTAEYVRLIRLAYQKLRPGGALVLETQNPECLAIYSQSFFVDPTHVRPIPAAQLRFWMEEAGFRGLATHYVSPLAPRLPQLPLLEPVPGNEDIERWNREAERFNKTYFGYQDYAVLGIKP